MAVRCFRFCGPKTCLNSYKISFRHGWSSTEPKKRSSNVSRLSASTSLPCTLGKSGERLFTMRGMGRRVAGVEGFEPPLRGPEPRVLPLDDTPVEEAFYIARLPFERRLCTNLAGPLLLRCRPVPGRFDRSRGFRPRVLRTAGLPPCLQPGRAGFASTRSR